MTLNVNHSTPADGSFSASGATAWNAVHTLSGTIDIANGGTGQTTSTAAINALLPTQATNSGKYLTTDGTNTSWATVSGGSGTVTSVALSAPSIFTVTGSPVTTSGTLALSYSGTALPVANGGSGATTLTGVLKGNGTSAFSAATAGTDYQAPITLTTTGTSGAATFVGNTLNIPQYSGGGMTYPGAGIANSTGSAWDTSYTTSGSGTVVALATGATLTNPTVTNYVETLYSANTSTAITVDLANGTVQNLTLTGNATITMPTAVAGKSFIIILSQDGTGSRTVTWSTVSWPSATAPTITSTASKKDIYSFFSNGTSWFGATIGQNYT
jgi:hypothetical protein